VFVGAGFVAEAGVAEHEVVIGLEIFGIDGECFAGNSVDGVGVALLEEKDAAEFVCGRRDRRGNWARTDFEGVGGFVVVGLLL